jgi:peptidoglycan hydrolase CwlO-like protein
MTRKTALASLVVAVVLCLFSAGCKDTKTLQENEQLKAQVADLQKQVGELGNNIETVTADRDNLKKENDALNAEMMKSRRAKKSKKRASSRKRHPAAA